jgi:hypothetical protein
MSHLIANSIGNTLTYLVAIFGGPRIIEYSDLLRATVRSYAGIISVVGAIFVGITAFFTYAKRRIFLSHRQLIVSVLWFFLFLSPFVGLGGVSERYVLFASGMLMIVTGLLLQMLVKRRIFLGLKALPFIFFLAVAIWNVTEMNRLGNEWKFAGSITKNALSSIKQQYFPPKTIKTFVFINTPIRYGRAWIFPTGLNDALWHMFRTTPYYTIQVSSIDQAFAYPHPKDTDKVILEFDNYQLKEVVKETQQPVSTPTPAATKR